MPYGNRGGGGPSRGRGQGDFDNTNRGILFNNDDRRNDKSPDMRGTLNIDGRDYWISGWWKETKKGDGLSLSVEPKDAARRGGYERSRGGDRGGDRGYQQAPLSHPGRAVVRDRTDEYDDRPQQPRQMDYHREQPRGEPDPREQEAYNPRVEHPGPVGEGDSRRPEWDRGGDEPPEDGRNY